MNPRGDDGIFSLGKQRRGQLTIFILVAVIILAAVVLFFVARNFFVFSTIPASIEPVYVSFTECLGDDVLTGAGVLGSQAGYIELPEFQPGSTYMPFSNQLDFLGNPIPYWYYVSGNGLQKEQVPSLNDVESQLEVFVDERIRDCELESYYEEGFEISMGEPKSTVKINKNNINIDLDMDLSIERGNDSVLISNHDISMNSKLGTLYDSAREIYDHEQETLFLERYAVDTLRLYSPVDGVELTCSPLVWKTNEVFSELQNAIEANTQAIKISGNEFTLNDEEDKYFVNDISVEGDVRFLNSKSWSYAYEVNPSENNILVANPAGANQLGLGILGFCYTPYHFVYDVKYPVLVQISEGEELFQFPFAVVIQGNNPREPLLDSEAVDFEIPELCEQKNTEITVNVYDTKLNLVNNAEISYECFGTKCSIGQATSGILKSDFPQCINGDVIVKAEGYKNARHQFSTVEQGIVDVVIDKLYELNVELTLDGVNYNGQATVSFVSDDYIQTIIYPEQKKIKLSEGDYEVQVFAFRNSSLRLGETKSEQCVEVLQTGIGGFFGFTKENCYTVEFPAQVVSNALAGGGKQGYYILESQLSSSNVIEINVQSFPTPNTIEQLQQNYILLDEKSLNINFR